MAKVPLPVDHIRTGKYVLNVESVGLSPEQFFRLCSDNPELRLELTAQKEIIVMSPTNSKTGMLNAEINRQLGIGFLIYPPKRQVHVYRPDKAIDCLDQPNTVSGDPELPGLTLDLTKIWQ